MSASSSAGASAAEAGNSEPRGVSGRVRAAISGVAGRGPGVSSQLYRLAVARTIALLMPGGMPIADYGLGLNPSPSEHHHSAVTPLLSCTPDDAGSSQPEA